VALQGLNEWRFAPARPQHACAIPCGELTNEIRFDALRDGMGRLRPGWVVTDTDPEFVGGRDSLACSFGVSGHAT
jgi:hypothetical protein